MHISCGSIMWTQTLYLINICIYLYINIYILSHRTRVPSLLSSEFVRGYSLNFRNHCWVLAGVLNSLHPSNWWGNVDWEFVNYLSNSHRLWERYRAGLDTDFGRYHNPWTLIQGRDKENLCVVWALPKISLCPSWKRKKEITRGGWWLRGDAFGINFIILWKRSLHCIKGRTSVHLWKGGSL